MNLKVLLALSAVLLVLSRFFSYPVLADEEDLLSEEQQIIESESSTSEESSEGNISQNSEAEISVEIEGNGEGSDNQINISDNTSTQILQSNSVEIVNNIKIKANTGDNEASGNTGSVSIQTGDIKVNIKVANKVNYNFSEEDCQCEETEQTVPSPTPTSSGTLLPSLSSVDGSSDGSGKGGSSSNSTTTSTKQGQVLGEMLPATGGFSLVHASLFTLLMLLSGIILRLDFTKAKKYVKKTKVQITGIFKNTQNLGKYINFNLPSPIPRYISAYF